MSTQPIRLRSAPANRRLARLPLQAAGVAAFLIFTLCLSLRLLYTLWPGSDWVGVWHDGANRRIAAETVAASAGKRIAEALDLVGRIDTAEANGLTAAQRTTVNITLAYAQQIIARSAHDCDDANPSDKKSGKKSAPPAPPTEVAARIGVDLTLATGLSATASLRTGPVPLSPAETWTPLGVNAPTGRQLQRIRAHLLLAQKLLVCRLRTNQQPAPTPTFLDLVRQRPPTECSPCKGQSGRPAQPTWGLLPDEVELYNKTYNDSLATRPPAFLGSSELAYFAIIFLFGVLGACVRGLASLAGYVGNRSFRPRWSLYYLIQPFIGGGLAMAFYAVLRGGFMNTDNSAAEVTNLYACSAVGVLVGIATREAGDKIKNVAETFFARSQAQDQSQDQDALHKLRSDVLEPVIQDVELASDGLSGTVRGKNLADTRSLYIDGRKLAIIAQGADSLHFTVPPLVLDAPDAPTPLQQADLKAVVVETPHGASAAYTDPDPTQAPPSPGPVPPSPGQV